MKGIFVSPLLLFAAGMCCEASAATIMGSVSDNEGKIIAGAEVKLNPIPSASSGPGAVAALPASVATVTATVSSVGEFEFDNVAPGKYSLCVTPNNRTHINPCGAPRLGSASVEVSASDTLIHVDLPLVVGVPILLTIALAENTSILPTNVFLDSADGRFFPMENDTQPGHFWVVVPPLTDLRVLTAIAGGKVGLPSEVVSAGAAGVSVAVTVSR